MVYRWYKTRAQYLIIERCLAICLRRICRAISECFDMIPEPLELLYCLYFAMGFAARQGKGCKPAPQLPSTVKDVWLACRGSAGEQRYSTKPLSPLLDTYHESKKGIIPTAKSKVQCSPRQTSHINCYSYVQVISAVVIQANLCTVP